MSIVKVLLIMFTRSGAKVNELSITPTNLGVYILFVNNAQTEITL